MENMAVAELKQLETVSACMLLHVFGKAVTSFFDPNYEYIHNTT